MARILVVFFLLAVVVEGAVRKWFLPEYANEAFVAKDVLIGAAFLAILGARNHGFVRGADLVPWVFMVFVVLGHAILAGWSFETAVGLRYYLAPIPLLVLVPALLRDAGDLEKLCRWGVWIAILEGILGTVQYLSPIDSPINAYVWGMDVAGFGGDEISEISSITRARVTGTFSFISTYAAFLAVVWLLAWLLLLHGRARSDRWLAAVGLVVIAFNMGMNGSRGLLLIAGVSGLPFAIAAIRGTGLIRGWAVGIVVALLFAGLGTQILEPFLLTFERGEFEEAAERTVALFTAPLATLTEIGFLGSGVGTTFGGLEFLGRRDATEFDEIRVDRVGVELGIIGYLFIVGLKVFVVADTFKVYRRLINPQLRAWALMSLLVQLSSTWTIPFYNAVAATGYFAAVGLLYWLRRIEALESRSRWPSERLSAIPGIATRRLPQD